MENKATTFNPVQAIEKYRFDLTLPVAPPKPVVNVNGGYSNFTLGNFSMVIAVPKSGKSFLGGAFIAGAIGGSTIGCVTPAEPGIQGILIDCEQGDYHLSKAAHRIVRQAATAENLAVYGLRPLKVSERLALIEHIIQGIDRPTFMVIDGLRDLVTSINDEAEATSISERLLRWTYEKPLHVMCILHMNKNDRNPRGHVGTEAQNKAETVLTIERDQNDSDVFVVTPKNTRDIDFPPFCFTIHENGLPYLTEQMESTQARKQRDIKENFAAVLPGLVAMDYSTLVTEYSVLAGIAERTAKRHISEAIKQKILLKNSNNNYYLNQRNDE